MLNPSERSLGALRALAIAIACAGALSGCVSDTVKSATSGDAGTNSVTRSLAFAEAPSYDLGIVAGGSTTLVRLSVNTTGTGDATITSTSNSDSNFTFNGGTFPGTGGTCAQPIQGNCSVAVLFTAPTSIGIYSDTVTINYTSGTNSGSATVILSASVTLAPAITINGAAPYSFGTKNVASSTDATLTVANAGGVGAASLGFSGLSAPIAFKGGSYPGTGGTCGTFLASAASCTIVVNYAPVSAGSTSRTLTASYTNGGTSSYTSAIAVSGTAVTLASLTFLTPVANPYDYGNVTVGSTLDATFTLSNGGGQSATALSVSGLGAPFNYKGGSYPGTGGTCGASLGAGSTCTLVVTYSPTAAVLSSTTLDVAYGDGSGSTVHVTKGLQGTGLPVALLAISNGPTYDYGQHVIGSNTDATLTVTNSGGSTATAMNVTGLSAPFAFKGGSFPGTGGTCTTSLAAAGTCTLVVTFSPTASTVSNATLTLGYNNGATTTNTTRALTGQGGTAALLALNGGATYAFGSKSINTSTDATLTIANSGTLTATALNLTGLSAPLSFKGGTYPGTGGTCAATLAASSSCTIVVTYAPTVAGATSQTLNVGYYNASTTTSTSQLVTGTGLAYALLSITAPTAIPYDYGNVTVGKATDVTFTVSNGGGQSSTAMGATGLSGAILFKGGAYPGTGGTCAATLAAASTCTLVVTFTPAAAVVYSKTMDLAYADGSGSTVHLTRGIDGTGIPPAVLTLSGGTTYDFGTHTIASNTDGTLTVTNTGGSPATSLAVTGISAPITFKGGSFPGTGGTCTTTLNASSSCTLVLRFTPSATATTNETLSLGYDDGANTQSVTRDLTGVGGSAAVLALNGGVTYAFGSKNVGSSTDATLTIANSGTLAATSLNLTGLSAPITFKGGTYPGTGGTCAASLAGSSSCTVVVTYAPTSAGATSKTLNVGYFDTNSTTSTSQSITGTGVALASLSVTNPVADPYNYGTVTIGASAVDQTFTVSNSGGQSALTMAGSGLAAPFSFKGGTYPGTGGTCGGTLAASTTCTMVVSFLPTTPGADSATLDLAYDDGSGSTIHLTRGVQGTGATPAVISISDGATYDYGSKSVGSTTSHTFTLTNSAGSTATSLAGVALTAPFAYKGGAFPGTGGNCTTSLAGNSACTVVVDFSPTGVGGFSETFSVTYNGGIGSQSADRSVTGTGGSVANLTISDGPTYNYGSVVKGYTVTKTFTVSNVGGATASSVSGAALSAPFSYLGGSFPGTGGTCGATIGVGGTCTVLVKFAPTATGAASGTLTVNYNDSVSATSSARALSGSGATIVKIAGGSAHTCALYSTGAVKCWGSNFYGQLGDGTNTDSATPVTVAGVLTATDLAAGSNHTCAMLSNGRINCWGADNAGQLGDNATLANQNSPAQVATYTDFTMVAAGGDVSCGLRSGGTIVCWGDDTEGANGNNATLSSNATPVTVTGSTTVTMTDVSVGRGHACGRKSDNTFRCWGSDSYGQLGNGGANTNSGVPVTPAPGTALSSVAGGNVSCAMLSGGTVKCWGADDVGQLGDNVTLASQTSPVTVAGLANMTSIKLGLKHGCALNASNTVVCWGLDSSGQIGDNASYTNQPTPVAVSGLTGVSAIGVGENQSFAILSSGLVYGWGANASGQLGDGTSANRPTPVLVQGL
ncbi:MAG: choice-of-anchor D domain-containing protein [Bdellovibrionales bacterium]|nr:choice-of-anchor D domain-containing protein [Bdellovibrionales bacterium]